MFKYLVYSNQVYKDFAINENGDVKNLKTGRFLKRTINKNGYYTLTLPLGRRGKVKGIRLHKALAETFIENPNKLPVVHHKDENKLNCVLSNLEWTTGRENTNDHWRFVARTNELCNNRKLTHEKVVLIRRYAGCLSRRELANMFGVSKTTISNVCSRKFYNTV